MYNDELSCLPDRRRSLYCMVGGKKSSKELEESQIFLLSSVLGAPLLLSDELAEARNILAT